MLRDVLELVEESLAEMKREGVVRLSVSEENLAALRAVIAQKTPLPAPATAAPPQNDTAVPPRADNPPSRATPTRPVATTPPPKSSAKPAFSIAPLPPPPQVEVPPGDKATQLAWLHDKVLNCPVCNAHKRPGKHVVFGVGNPDAELFFCGEAPGAEEETQGEPFVGPAGQLLTKIIAAMGLRRDQVYIGNIMKWRPEMPTTYGNRPPTPEEMAFCLPYLRAQLAIIRPKVIVALGATAIEGLLGPDPTRTIGRIHGHWQQFNDTPLMPTYHPSYLLRSNSNRSKRVVWEDLLKVMEHIGLPISDRQRAYFT